MPRLTTNEEILKAIEKLNTKFDTKFDIRFDFDGISSILKDCTKMTIDANKKCDEIQEDLNYIKKRLG